MSTLCGSSPAPTPAAGPERWSRLSGWSRARALRTTRARANGCPRTDFPPSPTSVGRTDGSDASLAPSPNDPPCRISDSGSLPATAAARHSQGTLLRLRTNRETPAPCGDNQPRPNHNSLGHLSQVHSPINYLSQMAMAASLTKPMKLFLGLRAV